jgi:TPR repeat protein
MSPAACLELAERYRAGLGLPRDTFEAARQAYRAAKVGHAAAQAWLQKQAEANEPSALLWFAREREEGGDTRGAAASVQAAERILSAGLLRRDPEAMTVRGYMVRYGLGSPQNPQLANDSLKFAAELGDARAQYLLGIEAWIFALRSESEAERGLPWLRAAAAQGHVQARTALGLDAALSHESAERAEASALLTRSAEQGDAVAQTALGVLQEQSRLPAQPTLSAHQWYERAAAQHNVAAQVRLCGKAEADALPWCRMAAENGSAQAAYALSEAYRTGAPPNPQLAIDWLEQAAKRGHRGASIALGLRYATGDGVPRDPGKAFRLLLPAAQQGDVRAQLWLGDAYEHGEGVAPDQALAAQWVRRAARAGDESARRSLSRMYAHGVGVVRDPQLAARWSEQAVNAKPAVSTTAPGTDPWLEEVALKFELLSESLRQPWMDANGKSMELGPWLGAQRTEPRPRREAGKPAGVPLVASPAALRNTARASAGKHLLCPANEVHIVEDDHGRFTLVGCGALTMLDCRTDPRCALVSEPVHSDRSQPSLSKSIIRTLIGTAVQQVSVCYEREYAGLPESQVWPTLQVKVKLIVPPAGGISERTIENAAEVPPKLGECMLHALDHIDFPAPSGGIVVVNYPFILQPG